MRRNLDLPTHSPKRLNWVILIQLSPLPVLVSFLSSALAMPEHQSYLEGQQTHRGDERQHA